MRSSRVPIAHPESYEFRTLRAYEHGAYERLLKSIYEQEGIFSEQFLPGPSAVRYGLFARDGDLVGICATTEVSGSRRDWFLSHVGEGAVDAWDPMVEITNFLIQASHHGGIAFDLMCYSVATAAKANGARSLVGVTRTHTLRSFVRFGLDVTVREPLHVLGRDDVNDYIVYYDLGNEQSVNYMHQRAARLFKQATAMAHILSNEVAEQGPVGGERPRTSGMRAAGQACTVADEGAVIRYIRQAMRRVDPRVNVESVSAKTLISDIGFDSVQTMEMISLVERRFEVTLSDADLVEVKRLADLVSLIQGR